MKFKPQTLIALFALVATLLCSNCGGGGGGFDGGSGPVLTQIEAVFASNTSAIVDPTNLQVGDNVIFQLAGYSANGNRTVLAGSGWMTTDSFSSAGTLNGSTGAFAASAQSSTYTVSIDYQGTNYAVPYRVLPVQARISGFVGDSMFNFPVYGVKLLFYNASNTLVGAVTTAHDGTFLASVPTSAVLFDIDPNTITSRYYKIFSYSGVARGRFSGVCSGGDVQFSGTSSGGNNTLTLNDTSQSWAANAFVGYGVSITAGTGAGQTRTIASNTATSLSLSTAWSIVPDASSTYTVNSNTLTDASANWLPGDLQTRQVAITSGTGAGQVRFVTGNTSTKLTVSQPWASTPDSTSTYSFFLLNISTLVTPCGAELPAGLSNGFTIPMNGIVTLTPTSQPPPPPSGCQ